MRTARVGGRSVAAVLAVVLVLTGFQWRGVDTVVEAAGQPGQPAQDEFVAAYALLWLAVIGYLWSIWRRMSTVEQELSALSRRSGES